MKSFRDLIPNLTPTDEQLINLTNITSEFKREIEEKFAHLTFPIELTYEGSFAKNTFLYPCDVDLFISTDRDNYESLVKALLDLKSTVSNSKIKFSKHPYLRVLFKGLEFDLVPIVKISQEDVLSSFDITPFHTLFMKRNLTKEKILDIRVFKYLLKKCGLYSSPLMSGGFTGILCETLVNSRGTLEAVLEELRDLVKPLSCLDPVTPLRDLGDSLSLRTQYKARAMARLLLETPESLLGDQEIPLNTYFFEILCEIGRQHERVLETQCFRLCSRLLDEEYLRVLDVTPQRIQKKISFIVETISDRVQFSRITQGPQFGKGQANDFHRFSVKGAIVKFNTHGVSRIYTPYSVPFEEELLRFLQGFSTKFKLIGVRKLKIEEVPRGLSRIEWTLRQNS